MMKNPLIQEKSILICQSEHGAVYVSYGAIQTVIKQVVLETPGVAEKDFNFVTQFLGKKTGSSVIYGDNDDRLEVDVSIKAYYGINIPAVCKEVQKLIAFNLSKLLGLENVIINVKVDELVIGEDVKTPQSK